MTMIKIKQFSSSYTQIPNWFITDFMPSAPMAHVKVYLYLSTLCQANMDFSVEDICKKLELVQSELKDSLDYWNKKGVLHFSDEDAETFSLEFYATPKAITNNIPSSQSVSVAKHIPRNQPTYTVDEIKYYKDTNKVVYDLLYKSEQQLGRLLTATDQKTILSFYDWLDMSPELIEYLIDYCMLLGKTSIRYIEKVAINWADQHITTVEQAEAQCASDKDYYKILRALRISADIISDVDKQFINKWKDTYKFSIEIILEACNSAVKTANKPGLKYVDSILTSWFNDGVKTLQDVEELNKLHQAKKKMQESSSYSNNSISNKIAAYNYIESNDWSPEELDRLQKQAFSNQIKGVTM